MEHGKLIDALVTCFRDTQVSVVCAYLFGSHARGDQRPSSDVDIAVLLPVDNSEDRGARLVGPLTTLRGDLERLLEKNVDLIDMRAAPVDLIHRILRDGHLLVERDRDARVLFEVRKRNEYFDLLPHLNRYRRGRAA